MVGWIERKCGKVEATDEEGSRDGRGRGALKCSCTAIVSALQRAAAGLLKGRNLQRRVDDADEAETRTYVETRVRSDALGDTFSGAIRVRSVRRAAKE
jgi:hypothetical protein